MSETEKVCIQAELDKGELYFKEEDAKLIRELRERHKKAADKEYRESHSYHCFRCGTKTLDPGELENIMKDEQAIKGIRKSFLSIFIK